MATKTLRPYQQEAVDAIFRARAKGETRILLVAATGSGKTVIAGALAREEFGNVLFLADAKELVSQAADKIGDWTGEFAHCEQGEENVPEETIKKDAAKVVVATTQSLARRMAKYPRDYFTLIIVDEAHRNTLGAQAQTVLMYFETATVVGVTATPYRSDHQELGSFYKHLLPCDSMKLQNLVRAGFLSPIKVVSVPCKVDLSAVRKRGADFDENDLAKAIEPFLDELISIWEGEAYGRRTVAFFPLVRTAKLACERFRARGIDAAFVSGEEREQLHGDWQVVCNASLLTTGWDRPDVSCVYICRPTKSLSLYSQMVGRGTRIAPNKKDCLILDPLFQGEKHKLIRPFRLICETQTEEEYFEHVADDGQICTLEDMAKAVEEGKAKHEAWLKKLEETARKKRKEIDPFSFCEQYPEDDQDVEPTEAQVAMLQKHGFDTRNIGKYQATRIIQKIIARQKAELASPRMLAWLRKQGIPHADNITQADAAKFLKLKIGGRSYAQSFIKKVQEKMAEQPPQIDIYEEQEPLF